MIILLNFLFLRFPLFSTLYRLASLFFLIFASIKFRDFREKNSRDLNTANLVDLNTIFENKTLRI